MVNNRQEALAILEGLNFDSDEASLYLELLKGPANHLRLARATGINRSKIYRLIERFEKRSLVHSRSDDRGTFLVASDPSALEVEILNEEKLVEDKRQDFDRLLPFLNLQKINSDTAFLIRNYRGEEGFKQMMWHELKVRDENLMLGRGNLSDLVTNKHWVSQHRQRMMDMNYCIRQLINSEEGQQVFTIPSPRYKFRILTHEQLPLENQICIYNDTVSIYYWRQPQKVGVEIINQEFAQMMRQMFENYWQLGRTTH